MAKRGRKPSKDLSKIACPNRNCPDFRKSGNPYIVSNGSYMTKCGRGRRFKCKTCGKSFCLKTGTIFEGLRAPDDKVIAALKILSKGMTIRKVAEILDVKPDTARHWLTVMAAQSEEVNRRLNNELGVSEMELETLWNSVKENKLRNRAIRWRRKCGWRKGWSIS